MPRMECEKGYGSGVGFFFVATDAANRRIVFCEHVFNHLPLSINYVCISFPLHEIKEKKTNNFNGKITEFH